MKTKAFLFIFISFLCFGSISAQKKNTKITITGQVVNFRQYLVTIT
jgi:hypothetical protein